MKTPIMMQILKKYGKIFKINYLIKTHKLQKIKKKFENFFKNQLNE